MKEIKSQVSVFEIAFLLVLIFGFIVYISTYSEGNVFGQHKLQVESFFNSIYYNGDFRNNFLNENLSSVIVSQNWSNLTFLLNSSFVNYELKISNETTTKIIFSCNETYGREIAEKIIAIRDNDYYEFRKVTFGVCY